MSCLITYSDSEEEPEPSAGPDDVHKKRKIESSSDIDTVKKPKVGLPPSLPSTFHNVYAAQARSSTTDDPSLHGGRQRQVPHILGKWPSHVYLEWLPSATEAQVLEELVHSVEAQINVSQSGPRVFSSFKDDLGVPKPLHVSLSAPLSLDGDVKDEYLKNISRAVSQAEISSFTVRATDLKWFNNFDKTRYFLVLVLSRPEPNGNQLNTMLSVCNDIAEKHALPRLYHKSGDVGVVRSATTSDGIKRDSTTEGAPTEEHFHISIGWSLIDPESKHVNGNEQLLQGLIIQFEDLRIKIGNIITSILLQ